MFSQTVFFQFRPPLFSRGQSSSRDFKNENFHLRLQNTIRDLADAMKQEKVPYVIIGGMGLAAYGFSRSTQDIDILTKREEYDRFKEKLFKYPFVTTREGGLAHAQTDVKIDLLFAGQSPTWEEDCPVKFPDPADITPVVLDEVRYLPLPQFVTLKLASGMLEWRQRDNGDVQTLITLKNLTNKFADELHPYVRESFLRLIQLAEKERLAEKRRIEATLPS
eukprot:TRINITY_DN2247_c0_g1_i1.p1 TRINITY_DN2247_c0_g1~~TRINITY_DN2247_c0_g1_i1.p1  ORF type:complete len:221 (-),score=32.93 TRINITY_DN2247_c0_g1_i1:35-697(-)